MDLRLVLLACASLLFSATALAELKPGQIPAHSWAYLAPNVSTQQDVLDLFGEPDEKVDAKVEKFMRRLDVRRAEKMKPCMPAGRERVSLWKYQNVNVRKGAKYSYDDRRDSEFTYLAFHEDGRVCGVIPYSEDF